MTPEEQQIQIHAAGWRHIVIPNISTMERQIKSLTAEVAALRNLLEEVQWGAGTEDDQRCPRCGELADTERHDPMCDVAAALKGNIGQDYMSPADVRLAAQPLWQLINTAKMAVTNATWTPIAYDAVVDIGKWLRAKGWVEEKK